MSRHELFEPGKRLTNKREIAFLNESPHLKSGTSFERKEVEAGWLVMAEDERRHVINLFYASVPAGRESERISIDLPPETLQSDGIGYPRSEEC